LRPSPRTSFHHQPEAQHPKIFSYPQAGPADYPIFGQGDIDHLRFHELVCAARQGKWNGEAKRPCRLHVDEKFELRDLLHRQVDVIGAGMDRSREPHDKVIVLKLI
jgi:hypothetical protein